LGFVSLQKGQQQHPCQTEKIIIHKCTRGSPVSPLVEPPQYVNKSQDQSVLDLHATAMQAVNWSRNHSAELYVRVRRGAEGGELGRERCGYIVGTHNFNILTSA